MLRLTQSLTNPLDVLGVAVASDRPSAVFVADKAGLQRTSGRKLLCTLYVRDHFQRHVGEARRPTEEDRAPHSACREHHPLPVPADGVVGLGPAGSRPR